MAAEDVTATLKGKEGQPDRSLTVQYDFGATLEDSKKLFGETVVKALFDAKAVIVIQDTMRRLLAAGKTEAEVTAYIAAFKLGVPTKRTGGGTRKTTEQKLLEAVTTGAISAESLQAIMAEIQKTLAAKKAGK